MAKIKNNTFTWAVSHQDNALEVETALLLCARSILLPTIINGKLIGSSGKAAAKNSSFHTSNLSKD